MKKSFIILSLFTITSFFLSCKKDNVSVPNFDVQTSSNTYKVGQEIIFNFTGNAQNIAFWSGAKGSVYANKDRVTENGVLKSLQFNTQAGGGTINNSLSLLVSKDFSGVFSTADIAKANWTDITNRANLSSNATPAAGANTASGVVNISDFATDEDTPVYFAFRYLSPSSSTLAPREWTISSFSITNTLADNTVSSVIASMRVAGFKAFDIKNPIVLWNLTPSIATVAMTMPGASVADNRAENEDWVISAPVKLNTVSSVDVGLPVSSLTSLSPTTSYKYTYRAPGVYKVTFRAFNLNLDEVKEVIKELTITITP